MVLPSFATMGPPFLHFLKQRELIRAACGPGRVPPSVAQTFARHATFALTMDIYTHLQVLDHRQALDVLPELRDNAEAEQARRVAAG